MRMILTVMAGIFSLAVMANDDTSAATTKVFDAEQTKQVEQIIHNYLIANPEIMLDVSRALQRKQKAAMMHRAKREISRNRTQLFHADSPVAGNVKGQISLVEFFDYQCKHCKDMNQIIHKLIESNANLNVIYKQLPIFGVDSKYAAQAALAAMKQGKFTQMHDALMAYDGRLTTEKVLELAKGVGLNVKQLKQDMTDASVTKELEANLGLAGHIGIMGTPAFIIAKHTDSDKLKSTFVAGALRQDMLQNLIHDLGE